MVGEDHFQLVLTRVTKLNAQSCEKTKKNRLEDDDFFSGSFNGCGLHTMSTGKAGNIPVALDVPSIDDLLGRTYSLMQVGLGLS